MKYDEDLLKELVLKYEKRDANSSKINRAIKIVITKEKYPKYFLDTKGYDEAINELSLKGFIKIKYIPHDTVIESISLNVDKIEEIQQLLGIDTVKEKRDRLLNELAKYNDNIIVNLKNEIETRIANNKTIKQYLSDDFIDVLKAVHYLENLHHDVYERNASNYIYNDSKRLSKLKTMIESIYDNDNVFNEKGVLSVTPYLYVKGEGIIKINDQVIDLKKLNTSIGIPIDNLNILEFKTVSKVTTIENLTTFYDYDSEGLIIYLGGFSTRSQIEVLKKIKSICTKFYHFGDIDYGGYTILNNLMENLNINIKTIKMNFDTLMSNLKYAQSFNDEKYVDKLKSLLRKPLLKPYYDVINYLIKNKLWLEQESFYNL